MKEQERFLLRVSEVADLIGVSKATAYDLINRGSIPSIRLAGRGERGLLRVPSQALRQRIDDYMKAQRAAEAEKSPPAAAGNAE